MALCILLTGFRAFGEWTINPTEELMHAVGGGELGAAAFGVEVETALMSPPGVPMGVVVPSLAVGTVAFAWHRVAPLTALAVGLTGLAVVPGAVGVDPASSFGWFVTGPGEQTRRGADRP